MKERNRCKGCKHLEGYCGNNFIICNHKIVSKTPYGTTSKVVYAVGKCKYYARK